MGGVYRGAAKKSPFVAACCTRAAARFGIAEIQAVGRKSVPNPEVTEKSKGREQRRQERRLMRQVSHDIVDRVDAVLPERPWKPGIHRLIAAQIGLDPMDVLKGYAQMPRRGDTESGRNPRRPALLFRSPVRRVRSSPW
jgi:hypothetical protein